MPHYPVSPSKMGDRGTLIHWAKNPKGTLVLFVHGFGGHPTQTWEGFPRAVRIEPEFSDADVIFYAYKSVEKQAQYSSDQLFHAIDFITTNNQKVSNEEIENACGIKVNRPLVQYQKVVVIAHSLGGAIARQVAYDAKRLGRPWADNLKLVLFAPAHMGAKIADLFFRRIGPLSAMFNLIAHISKAVSLDLERESLFMKNLRKNTREWLIKTGPFPPQGPSPLIADVVLHAEGDGIIDQTRFCYDPPAYLIPDFDHVELCKPSVCPASLAIVKNHI